MKVLSISVPMVSKLKNQRVPAFKQLVDYGAKDNDLIYVPILHDEELILELNKQDSYSENTQQRPQYPQQPQPQPQYPYGYPPRAPYQNYVQQNQQYTNSANNHPANSQGLNDKNEKSGSTLKSLAAGAGFTGGGFVANSLVRKDPKEVENKGNEYIDKITEKTTASIDCATNMANKIIDNSVLIKEHANHSLNGLKENFNQKILSHKPETSDVAETHSEDPVSGYLPHNTGRTSDDLEAVKNNPDFNPVNVHGHEHEGKNELEDEFLANHGPAEGTSSDCGTEVYSQDDGCV